MKEATLEEYNQITTSPSLDKKIILGKRYTTVQWSYCGTPVAEKTELLRRGKIESVYYSVNEKFL